MKKNLLIAVLSMLMGGAIAYALLPRSQDMKQENDYHVPLGTPEDEDRGINSIKVYFSPNGGCTEAACAEIRKAKVAILVQAYSLTSKTIAAELIAAQKRGVRVAVIVDSGAAADKYCVDDELLANGCEVFIDAAHAIAHNKVMIIDSTIVVSGSFNFSEAAEKRNAENLLVIKNAKLAALYEANWAKHMGHSPALEKP
jgi:phosphatidylserine/phosphatidylglycerophosphate/cardiolipin synthase-like enzyme